MSDTGSSSTPKPLVRVSDRLWSVAVALGTGAVLAVAAVLEPSAKGYGTHHQLGLGECTFLGMTGHPCPMCGATTSFALMAHLQPWSAVVTQPFAVLLFLLVAGSFGVSIAEIADPAGRWSRIRAWIEPREAVLAAAFLAAMAAGWAYKWVAMS